VAGCARGARLPWLQRQRQHRLVKSVLDPREAAHVAEGGPQLPRCHDALAHLGRDRREHRRRAVGRHGTLRPLGGQLDGSTLQRRRGQRARPLRSRARRLLGRGGGGGGGGGGLGGVGNGGGGCVSVGVVDEEPEELGSLSVVDRVLVQRCGPRVAAGRVGEGVELRRAVAAEQPLRLKRKRREMWEAWERCG
jgi:hypothetical protein